LSERSSITDSFLFDVMSINMPSTRFTASYAPSSTGLPPSMSSVQAVNARPPNISASGRMLYFRYFLVFIIVSG